LGDLVSRPEFRHWEIHDALPRFEFDLNVLDEQPEVRIVELTHRAAFRNALSNSLYAPRYNLHNLNSELLHEFRNRNFTSNRLTLVGVGIKHDDLVRQANLFRLPNASNTQRQQARYLGCNKNLKTKII
jgi:ubiquinol-cytochrome c reductase core subunit 2